MGIKDSRLSSSPIQTYNQLRLEMDINVPKTRVVINRDVAGNNIEI